MQQYNIKTLPDNLAAAIKIINEAIRRSQERDDSPASSADGKKLQQQWNPRSPSAVKCNKMS